MNVPQEFQRPIKVAYPDGNRPILEEWLMSRIDHPDYLPVNWCGYFVNNNYGNDKNAMRKLQRFIDSLPTDRQIFSVTQYDLGIIANISRLNIKVFGSGGGRIDFPLPLVCQPHGYDNRPKTIFANFVGSITHPIRKRMIEACPDEWYIHTKPHEIKTFCAVLARSIFTLCPRGFGLTSFRICEALEQKSIPVYISDRFIIPGNQDFNEYGVLVEEKDIERIPEILRSIPQAEIESKRLAGERVYKELYSYEGTRKLILDNL